MFDIKRKLLVTTYFVLHTIFSFQASLFRQIYSLDKCSQYLVYDLYVNLDEFQEKFLFLSKLPDAYWHRSLGIESHWLVNDRNSQLNSPHKPRFIADVNTAKR